VGLRDGRTGWPECAVRVELAKLFGRAFVMVFLVSANTVQISQRQYAGAFLCGCLISLVWYLNVGKASHDQRWQAVLAYALGAGCGTVCGMWISG
jgi:uncharacterized membrane protein YdjX (TVP38/TMEM64 family)